jgi:hypothetical protein
VADHKKPLGVTLVVLYSALTAFMLIPVGCTATVIGQAPGFGGFAAILGYLATLFGLLSCAIVYGLWTFQEWGRSLAYWLYLASVPLGVTAIFPPLAGPQATTGNTVFQMVTIAIDLFIIAYLATPEVKELFAGSEASASVSTYDRKEPF